MKQDNYDNYDSLNRMADSLPFSKERSLLREKALNLVDTLNDERKQFEARINYVNDVCTEGSFPEKYLSVFPWLLSYIGKYRDNEDILTVLWYYKWVIMIMPEFPAISLQQIENALFDLRQKYREHGSTDKVFHDYSCETYHLLGDYKKSALHHKKHLVFKRRDQLDDCEACVLNRIVTFYIVTGDMDEALKRAKPLITGKKTCTHVPKDTYANFIAPLLIEKKYNLAAEFSEKLEKNLKKIKHGANYKSAHPMMLNYIVHGKMSSAVKLFEKYLADAFMEKGQDGKFYFYSAAINLFSKIEKETIKLKLPQNFPLHNKESIYSTKSLIDWLDKETDRIASLFDKRNGNDKYQKQKSKILSIDRNPDLH